MSKTLFDLIKIIKKRKSKNSNKSYTYFLFRNGKAYCLKKFKEEALELIKALQSNKKKNTPVFFFIISIPLGIIKLNIS